MFTMRPDRCRIIPRMAALVHRNAPFKLVSNTASQSSSLNRITRLSRVMPALFTRMSSPPRSVDACATNPSASFGEATLPATTSAAPPAARISSAASRASASPVW